MPPPLLLDLVRRGMTVTVEGDRLAVRPPSALTDPDRTALRVVKAELMAYLAPTTVGWDVETARALTADADELVERLGVVRTHPELRRLAERAAEASRHRDMPTLVRWVRTFELAAYRLAAELDHIRNTNEAKGPERRT